MTIRELVESADAVSDLASAERRIARVEAEMVRLENECNFYAESAHHWYACWKYTAGALLVLVTADLVYAAWRWAL